MIHFDFSSDLDMGRRPELKSDKKSKCIIIVIEILSCEHLFTAKKVLRLFGASLRVCRWVHFWPNAVLHLDL